MDNRGFETTVPGLGGIPLNLNEAYILFAPSLLQPFACVKLQDR